MVTVEGVVTIVVPPSFMVIVEVAVKPEPETVTVVPTGPDVGFSVIDCDTV